jgi:hypothetical protein
MAAGLQPATPSEDVPRPPETTKATWFPEAAFTRKKLTSEGRLRIHLRIGLLRGGGMCAKQDCRVTKTAAPPNDAPRRRGGFPSQRRFLHHCGYASHGLPARYHCGYPRQDRKSDKRTRTTCMHKFFAELNRISRAVQKGADPIEAMHGHICGPKCWHRALTPRPAKRKRRSVTKPERA